MKKHMKKWLAALVAALVVCSVTACSPAATSSKADAASGAESKTDVSSKAEEAPVTLKYINYGAKPETGDCDRVWAKLNEMLLDNVNCTIDVEYLGSGDAAQMKLKFAGNEAFDFCYTANWWDFYSNAQSNAFLELSEDLIKENMPYAYKQLPNIAWRQASVGGKIYMIPQMSPGISNWVIGYRGDLLEKYGMKDLETLEDFEAYLTKVAETETGMIAAPINGFEKLYMNYKSGWKDDAAAAWTYKISETSNPEMFYTVMQDEYMEYAKKMREFYTKGFWTSDLINDNTAAWDRLANGTASVLIHNSGTVESKLREISVEHPEWNLKMFNPYKGASVMYGAFNTDGWALNRTTTHADKVLQAVDFIYGTEDAQKLMIYGFEGDSYKMEDGYLVPLDGVAADKQHNLGCNWNMTNWAIQRTFLRQEHYTGYDEIYSDMENHVVENPLQAFTFDNSNVATEIANITAVVTANNALNYGMVDDVEGAVEKFRADLKDAGYDKVKAEYDRQVKEFMATYKK